MLFLFFVFWVLLNGRITLEILVFGAVIAAAVFCFTCRFLDYSFRKEILLYRSLKYIGWFLGVLVVEIFKANWQVTKLVLSPKYEPEPEVVTFQVSFRYGISRVMLANAITLTPGTVTVAMNDRDFCVHALDKSMAEGIEDSIFVHILKEMEAALTK